MNDRPDTRDVLINLAAFQCAWLSLALGAAHGLSGVGIVVAIAVMVLHLRRSPDVIAEAKLMTAALLLGIVVESALMAGGLIVFEQNSSASGQLSYIAPAWILSLWPAFATLLNVTLRPFRKWIVGAIVVGAALVPAAYWAGKVLGAMIIPEPALRSLAVIGLAWAIALPVLFALARFWDGWRDA